MKLLHYYISVHKYVLATLGVSLTSLALTPTVWACTYWTPFIGQLMMASFILTLVGIIILPCIVVGILFVLLFRYYIGHTDRVILKKVFLYPSVLMLPTTLILVGISLAIIARYFGNIVNAITYTGLYVGMLVCILVVATVFGHILERVFRNKLPNIGGPSSKRIWIFALLFCVALILGIFIPSVTIGHYGSCDAYSPHTP